MPRIMSSYSFYAIIVFFFLLVVKALRRRLSTLPLPPGPKGRPFIGNLLDIPPSSEWITYAGWSRKYGSDVIHLDVLGSHLVIVNSAEAAYDLFDKRSAIYSDRPRVPMLCELIGWDIFLFCPYNDQLRASRRLFNQFYSTSAVADFYPQMTKATHELLYRLAHTPEQFRQHCQLLGGSLILNVTYGMDVQDLNHPFLKTVGAAMETFKAAAKPGAFLVDVIPLLKYVPAWVPGAGFKRKAKIWRKHVDATSRVPFELVKSRMETSIQSPSMTSIALEQLETEADPIEEEDILRSTSASAFVGGADTISSAISGVILAMVLHPDIQKRAQEEIDRVIGEDRLPEVSDLPSLQYINAIVKETHRWKPAGPTGFAHRLTQDDVYNGYFIPAGSLVLGNIWSILHDERTYKDPEIFNPERFLKDGKLDPDAKSPDVVYGFGRRICPGRHFANSAVMMAAANILAAFDLGYAIDEDGKNIIPSAEYTYGTPRHPVPFKCSIKPRSDRVVELIAEAYSVHHPE